MACQIVIVLGMHRSGTSAIAGYLHGLGLELPSSALEPHPQDNPEGYFEPQRMVQLNNRLLGALGLTWHATRPISAAELNDPALEPLKAEIQEYLAEVCQPGRKLVFKDPRLCRLLPVWLPLIQHYCPSPCVVRVVRNANAVADSLARRAERPALAGAAITDRFKATLLWLRYNLDAWQHSTTQGVRCYALRYEAFTTKASVRSNLEQWLATSLGLVPGATPPPPRPVRAPLAPTAWPTDPAWQQVLLCAEDLLAAKELPRASHWLGNLYNLAQLRIPASHQNEPVAPPPESVVIAATINHISTQQAKPRCRVPHPLTGQCGQPKEPPPAPRLVRWLKGMQTALGKRAPKAAPTPLAPQAEYVFITENPSSRSHIYRVKNPVDALNRAGYRALWLTLDEAVMNPHLWASAKLLVVHRCEWSDSLDALYYLARANQVPTLYDIDDYIFEPKLAEQGHIHFISQLPPEDKKAWLAKIANYRKALLHANAAMAPTQALVTAITQLGIPCYLKPNGLSPETLALAKHWQTAFSQHRATTAGPPRVGYASGTATHEQDFATIRPALLSALSHHPGWHFTVIGHLSTNALAAILGTRLEHRPLVEHVNLPYELARCQLNLAPLEVGNPFCEAKSPLKWFEAAACGTPCIASATQPFSEAIAGPEQGYLCADHAEWLRTLLAVFAQPDTLAALNAHAVQRHQEDQLLTDFLLPALQAAGRHARQAHTGFFNKRKRKMR